MGNKRTVRELVELLPDALLVGDDYRYVDNVAPIDNANESSLCFLDKGREMETKSNVIVCDHIYPTNKTLIVVSNPRDTFAEIVKRFFTPEFPPPIIGKDCEIHSSSYILPNVIIGDRVKIGVNCVIGGSSLGYYEGENNTFKMFPQIGRVIIGNDVHIFNSVYVDRGAIEDTVIGEGTVIDSFAHVGHNDKIGKYVAMTSGTVLGGSVTIGDYCWVAQHVAVRDHIKIGNRVILGQGASVVSDIPDDAIAVGVPAKVIGQNIPFRRIP